MADFKQVPSLFGDIDAFVSGANNRDVARPDFLSMSAAQQHDEVQRIVREAHAARRREIHAAFRSVFAWFRSASMAAGVGARHVATRLITGLARLYQAYANHRQRLRAAAELGALSDRDLKDIGLYRSGIGWAVTHGRDDWPASPARIVRPVSLPTSAKPIASDPPATARERRQRAA